jgi:hypothetical protein
MDFEILNEVQLRLGKPVNLLKRNLSILLIIPTVLGGLWQLIELIIISPTLVRFFSLTQMIPDGLLILAAFAPSLFLLYLYNKLMAFIFKGDPSILKRSLWSMLPMLLYIGVLYLNTWFNISEFSAMLIYICCFVLTLTMGHIHQAYYYHLTGRFIFRGHKLLLTLYFGAIYTLGLWILHDVTKKIDEVSNVDRVRWEIKYKYPTKAVTFMYMNDKYIFYKLSQSKFPDRFAIVPFEKLITME